MAGNQLVECHECHGLYHQVAIPLYSWVSLGHFAVNLSGG